MDNTPKSYSNEYSQGSDDHYHQNNSQQYNAHNNQCNQDISVDTKYMPHRNDIKQSNTKDWKKLMSNRLVDRIMKYREQRIDDIREKKFEILKGLKQEDDLDFCMEEDGLMSEFFDRILMLFEDRMIGDSSSLEYTAEVGNNTNISFCCHCGYPVVLVGNRVACMNFCFELNIDPHTFNENFTLDNLMDIYSHTYRSHKQCGSSLNLLVFENDISFVCSKCFNYLN